MAKLFGSVDEEQLKDIPDEIVQALKAADSEKTKTDERIAALEAQLAKKDPPKGGEGGGDNQWGVTPEAELGYQTRCDMILMKIMQGRDAHAASAVKLFEDEIRENLNKSHPAHRANEQFVKNVIDMVKGRHAAEIIADLRAGGEKFGSFFVEDGGSGKHGTPQPKPLAERLTAEMKKAADSFGISYEDYAKELDGMGALPA